MLKIIDRYILFRYLATFFFIILLMGMLTVVIDFSEKVDSLANGPKWTEVVFDYYLNFVPYISSMLFPLYALIAVIYFCSRLAANSEIIAIIGNGISFWRLLRPFMMGAAIIAGFHLYANHFIFPELNKGRTRFENTYIRKNNFDGPKDNIHLFVSSQEEIYIQHYNRKDSTGRNFALIRYDSNGVDRPYTLEAGRIKLIEYPNKWELINYHARQVDDMEETIVKGAKMDTLLPLSSADLARRKNLKDAMNSREIMEYIEQEKAKGLGSTTVFEVEYHRRSADPFSILILTLIGVSIAARKTRGGMGMHIVMGMLVCALYIFMSKFSMTFSTHGGLSPLLGVWTPNIIFTFVAFYLASKAQK